MGQAIVSVQPGDTIEVVCTQTITVVGGGIGDTSLLVERVG